MNFIYGKDLKSCDTINTFMINNDIRLLLLLLQIKFIEELAVADILILHVIH